jgi:hypothetical protein
MRPGINGDPVRIPMRLVDTVDRKQIKLSATAESLGMDLLEVWVRDKIVSRIPGGTIDGSGGPSGDSGGAS